MGGGAAGRQRQEGIAVCQPPDDNLFHCRNAEALNVMLQDDRNIVAAHTVDNVLGDLVGIGCFTGIAAADIPVLILIAKIGHILCQPAHNAGVETADGIGTAAGEAQHSGTHSGLAMDNI